MTLRPYQQAAFDSVIEYIKTSVEPCLIEAATGAGKSHIIAAIANWIHARSGKRVLCLQPSAELLEQNREKYLLTSNPASVFSASGGGKCLLHPVVFATPGTVKNAISRFKEYAAVILDEAHGITPTIKAIVEQLRKHNQNLRVIGLSATPYRLNTGYIYRLDETGKPVDAVEPYFMQRVANITAHELIAQGYLTKPVVGDIQAESYDTSGLELNKLGKYNADAVDRAYNGQGRKTALAIADIVNQSRDRKCVIIFAATVQHAKECMESLPRELSVMVTAETKNRRAIVKQIKAHKYKYIVNVGVFTTGFDVSFLDVVALLRLTESVSLLQQMIGRGLRIAAGKEDVLILDYAGNLERHCPDGDIFSPEVKTSYQGTEKSTLTCSCPSCGTEQEFSARPNIDGFPVSETGYFLDLDGNEIKTDFGSMPAHFGRRCQAFLPSFGGKFEQCGYRWTFKECEACGHENDIAARYCAHCKAEIVDPNEKLRLEFKALKRDPTRVQCDNVLSMDVIPTVSRAGNDCVRVDFVTEYRSFAVWLRKDHRAYKLFEEVTRQGPPTTVTYHKDPNSKFYNILAYNQDADTSPN